MSVSLYPFPFFPFVLDIQVAHIERVIFDEAAARFYLVAHKDGKDLIGLDGIVDAHLQKSAGVRIHRRFPKLLGIHFAEAFVTLD